MKCISIYISSKNLLLHKYNSFSQILSLFSLSGYLTLLDDSEEKLNFFKN